MARLSRSYTQPSRELSYSTPLSQPLCDPVRLFCGREPDELPKDPAEELPGGAADGRELKAGAEGGEDQGSRRGRGCGACMWR